MAVRTAEELEKARQAGTLGQIVGYDEAAKWGNKPVVGDTNALIGAFGAADINNSGGGGGDKKKSTKAAPLTPAQQAAQENAARFPAGGTVGMGVSGGAGGTWGGGAAPAAFAGLQSSTPSGGGSMGNASNVSGGSGAFTPGEGGESGGPGVQLSAPGALRQGIGTRILPRDSMALAGLQRLY